MLQGSITTRLLSVILLVTTMITIWSSLTVRVLLYALRSLLFVPRERESTSVTTMERDVVQAASCPCRVTNNIWISSRKNTWNKQNNKELSHFSSQRVFSSARKRSDFLIIRNPDPYLYKIAQFTQMPTLFLQKIDDFSLCERPELVKWSLKLLWVTLHRFGSLNGVQKVLFSKFVLLKEPEIFFC